MEDIGKLPRSEVLRLLDEWIHSERNRAIARRKILDGLTLEEVAEEFNLSVRQVSTILKQIKSRITATIEH